MLYYKGNNMPNIIALLLHPIYFSVECKIPKARDIVLFTAQSPALTTTTQHIGGDQNFRRIDE